MKKVLLIFVLVFIAINYSYSQFNSPESVLYNNSTHTYLVTDAVDGKILKLDTMSNVTDFTTGLTSPKGIIMGLYALWVTDNKKIVEIEPETGEIIQEHPIQGAMGLNDIVADDFGNLYISDMLGNKIYKYDELSGATEIFANNLEMPNGLYYDYLNVALIVVSFGQSGLIYAVDLVDGSVTQLMQTNLRLLDGIAFDDKRDRFYISSWGDNAVYSLDPTFLEDPVLLQDNISGPADILYNSFEDVLAVPAMNTGHVIFINFKTQDTTAVEDKFTYGLDKIKIYPNPVTEKIYLKLPDIFNGDIKIKIFNILSQSVLQLETNITAIKSGINVSKLQSGIYYLSIEYRGNIETKQFVK